MDMARHNNELAHPVTRAVEVAKRVTDNGPQFASAIPGLPPKCRINARPFFFANIPIDDMCRLRHNHLTTSVVHESTTNTLRAQHAKTDRKLDLRST